MSDAFELFEDRETEVNTRELVWNTMTILMVLNTVIVGIYILTLFVNPFSGMNPFPPAPWTPTATPTPRNVLPPTWTPTGLPVTNTPEPTSTPKPTNTPLPTVPTEVVATEIPTDVPTEVVITTPVESPFVISDGSPQYIANLYHPDEGCKWLGVAGQVFDMSGAPILNQLVELGGELNGETVSMVAATGLATSYGESGFEFVLGNQTTSSSESLWLQLIDHAGLPVSDQFYFDTYDDCEQNLVLINFRQR